MKGELKEGILTFFDTDTGKIAGYERTEGGEIFDWQAEIPLEGNEEIFKRLPRLLGSEVRVSVIDGKVVDILEI